MPPCMSVHNAPVIPRLLSRPRTRSQRIVVLTRFVAPVPTPVGDWHSLPLRLFIRHHPAKRQFIKMLAEELGDVRIFQGRTRVGYMKAYPVVELISIGIEMKRRGLILIFAVGIEYIVGPVFLSDFDEEVCKATQEKQNENSLGREGGVQDDSIR